MQKQVCNVTSNAGISLCSSSVLQSTLELDENTNSSSKLELKIVGGDLSVGALNLLEDT